MLEINDLLRVVDAYRTAEKIEDKTVSSRVFGDSKKIKQLREGNDLTTSRFRDAMTWFSANWPAAAEWPEGVMRPAIDVQA